MTVQEKMNFIVKQRMVTTGVKQKFLAKECGYDEKTFSLLINGYKSIKDKDVINFCRGMNVDPNEVFSYSSA